MRRLFSPALALAVALVGAGFGAAPAQAAAVCEGGGGVCVAGLTLSTRTLDTTQPGRSVTVTVRVTSTTGAPRYVDVKATSARGSAVNSSIITDEGGDYPVTVRATQTSGTASDGVYTAVVPLPGGAATTWSFAAETQTVNNNWVYATTGQLAAAGLPTTVTTTVTAVPATPTGVAAVTTPSGSIGGPITIKAKVSATVPTSGVGAVRIQITPSGACAGPVVTTGLFELRGLTDKTKFWTIIGRSSSAPGLCTFVVRAVNDKGLSAGSVTVRAVVP